MALRSFVSGAWVSPSAEGTPLLDAVTGEQVATVSSAGIDMRAALDYGRTVGGPALRDLTFHQRAAILKSLGLFLREHRPELYALSARAGSTLFDAKFDVDGGIGALASYASKGRRELPDGTVLLDGDAEPLGRGGQFLGQHILTPRHGVAVDVNAFNFPVWGTAGEVRNRIPGRRAEPGQAGQHHRLHHRAAGRAHGRVRAAARGFAPADLRRRRGSVRPPHRPGSGLVHRVGVHRGVAADQSEVVVGNPADESVRMGALASLDQREEVRRSLKALLSAGTAVFGDPEHVEVTGADAERGAFISPVLIRAEDAGRAEPHEGEAFGPVSTLIGYRDTAQAVELAARGLGSLARSVVTGDAGFAGDVVLGVAPWHGRLLVLDTDDAAESTGHGAVPPMLVHGGPGRAGGGEELGGLRGVTHYMQRTAVQGSPKVLAKITGRWVPGSERTTSGTHPFRKPLSELRVGDAVVAGPRTVAAEDIAHFAEFTGDTFYAHTDAEAAAANPFFDGIVAHGYLVLSLAGGLFVDPDPGPVLANYGIDNLRFLTPVYPGDELTVTLTCKAITPRGDSGHGEVRWDAEVTKQDGFPVARYDVLTMVAREWPA